MSITKALSKLVAGLAKNETIKTVVLSAALRVAAANIDKTGAKLKVPVPVTELAKAALAEEVLKRTVKAPAVAR